MAIADLLAKLIELKSQLVANLSSMGVTADESEKLNTLVPKVLECKTDIIWSQGTVSTEVTSVNIPNGVTSIGAIAFGGYTSLVSITIPDSVTSIGRSAFSRCSSRASVKIPSGVTSIGDIAFGGCTSLVSITIPDSVTSIGRSAFSRCSSLASITIPNSVTSIVDMAFDGCTSLANITIPDSVTSIGRSAFNKCTNLANIYYIGTEEQWNAITKSTNWNKNMGSNVEGGTVIHYNYVPE